MGRPTKNTPIPPALELNEEQLAHDVAELSTAAAIDLVQTSALDVGRIVGRIEHAMFSARCAEKVIAESFIQLRDRKKYKDLSIRDAEGNLRRCADLPEACEFLFGKSYRACAEIAQRYELLGPQLFEAAENLGLRRNDYRALRALPSDDQKLVTEALKDAGDRDSVAELIEELVSRQQKAVAERDTRIEELAQQAVAHERLLDAKNKHIDELAVKLQRREGSDLVERAAALTAEIDGAANEAIAFLLPLRNAIVAAHEVDPMPEHLRLALGQAICRVMAAAQEIAIDYGIAIESPLDPASWETEAKGLSGGLSAIS